MDFERSSASTSQSDYSQASVVSLGPSIHSIQAGDGDHESSPLLLDSSTERNEQRQGTSWYASIFLVVNAALGAGLLNFPEAYYQSGGLVVGIAVQLVLGVFIIGSMLILIYCAQRHNNATYQDVVFSLCGKNARILCSVTVALYAFGTCVTFFIIIGDQLDKFLSIFPNLHEKWFFDRKFTITVTCVLIVLPLCFPQRIDFLKIPSAVGVLAVFYCVVLVAVKYFTRSDDAEKKYPVDTKAKHWTDVFLVIPVICFGYQCHLSLVPIYSCMKRRTLPEFSKTIFVALLLCFLAYTITASLGYLTFGSSVRADILSCYNPTADVLVAVIGIALKMYTTYPILLFVGRAALDSVWMDIKSHTPAEMETGEKFRRISIASVWFVVSLLLALFAPNIGIVISLLGGLAALFIFVFPGLCLLQLLLQGYIEVNCPVKELAWFSVAGFGLVLGGFIFGLTTTQSIWDDIYGTDT